MLSYMESVRITKDSNKTLILLKLTMCQRKALTLALGYLLRQKPTPSLFVGLNMLDQKAPWVNKLIYSIHSPPNFPTKLF